MVLVAASIRESEVIAPAPPAGDNDRTTNHEIVPVHRCISCCEPIHADARVCPHCRTSQLPQRWQLIGRTLKWIGGITAVISLVIGAVRVNELYGNWRETHNTVQEMVYVSSQLLATHDYQGGWKLLGEALTLQPTSPAARRFQEQFAMTWLQDIHKSEEVSWAEVVDPLIPVLYRATLNKEKQRTADAYAHIGWANYLKNRDAGTRKYEVETLYEQALTIDPDNAYAHAYWPHGDG